MAEPQSQDEFVSVLRGQYHKDTRVSPLEKIAHAIGNLTENQRLSTSSIGFVLVPEAILRLWEEYGPAWLNIYFDKFKDSYTSSGEALAQVTQAMNVSQQQCLDDIDKLKMASSDPAIELAIKVGDLITTSGEMMRSVQDTLKHLSPEEAIKFCRNLTEGQYPGFFNEYIVPEVHRKILLDLNSATETLRITGLFMVAYATFKDKITNLFIKSSDPNIAERALANVISNGLIASGAIFLNSLLTFTHTGGYFIESMARNMDTVGIATLVMTGTRLLADETVKDVNNRKFLEFIAGGATLVALAGNNSLAILKFALGFFG